MSHEFRRYLFYKLGRYESPHVKQPTRDGPFRLDDFAENEAVDAMCRVRVWSTSELGFRLALDNLPITEKVVELVRDLGGEIDQGEVKTTAIFQLLLIDFGSVRRLGNAIGETVKRGRHYRVANWKWACPRIANALHRLADLIEEFNKARHIYPGAWRGRWNSEQCAIELDIFDQVELEKRGLL